MQKIDNFLLQSLLISLLDVHECILAGIWLMLCLWNHTLLLVTLQHAVCLQAPNYGHKYTYIINYQFYRKLCTFLWWELVNVILPSPLEAYEVEHRKPKPNLCPIRADFHIRCIKTLRRKFNVFDFLSSLTFPDLLLNGLYWNST